MYELKCPHCGEVFTVNEEAYASIANQVRNAAFNEDVHKRLKELKTQWEAEEKARQLAVENNYKDVLSEKNQSISDLKAQVESLGNQKDLQYNEQIATLRLKIKELEGDLKVSAETEELNIREAKREERTRVEGEFKKIEEKLREEIELKKCEIDRLENYKLSQSTKMIGESLEEYCHNEYEANLRPLLPNAYFEKDNEVLEGSKGDFIFRDYAEDGTEYVSIMFEMKNEADATDKKHKNEDFFKKLDSDRTKKKCDYAVLVSMLEQDNVLYNRGIVDVSHKYPKMYVIRPQFLIPIITLLRNAEQRNISVRQQLQVVQNDNKDFTVFEGNIRRFTELFKTHHKNAKNNFDQALESIDKSIEKLQAIRKFLETADSQLGYAEGNLDDLLDFKKVAKGAPSIQVKLQEAKAHNDEVRKSLASPDEQ